MFNKKTVKSIYDKTIAELKVVEQENREKQRVAEGVMRVAQKKVDAASDEVQKSRAAQKGFAELFGIKGDR